MAESSATLHESRERLSQQTIDLHRALVSLQEELEAVDWYRQRADACKDPQLRSILAHNMREEIEHASMLLEWLRRENPDFAENLGTYLGAEGPITEIEEEATTQSQGPSRQEVEPAGQTPAQSAESANPAETFTVGTMKEAT